MQALEEGAKLSELPAAILSTQRPYTEMLAVVRQDAIALLAQSRARPLHHFATIEELQLMSNPDFVAMREILERNVFHRSTPQSAGKTGVVNDAAVANVNPVVTIEPARGDEMRTEWRLLAGRENEITRQEALVTQVSAAYIVFPPEHRGPRYVAWQSVAIVRWC
jgi:hypothetical protein